MSYKDFIDKLENKVDTYFEELNKNNNAEKSEEAFLFSHNSENSTYVKLLNIDDLEKFNEIVSLILSYSNVSERFSIEHIENKIVELFHQILIDNTDTRTKLESLYSNLKKDSDNEWFIVSEIENIRLLDIGPYQLINSTIKKLDKSDIPSDIDLKTGRNSVFIDCLEKPCIYTNIKAGDSEKACMLAINNFMISFNLLRLYAPNFKPAIKGTLVTGNQEIIRYNKTKQISGRGLYKMGDLPTNHAFLNNDYYTYLEKEGIKDLSNQSSINKVVKDCLHWYGIGLDENMPSARLLIFVTILETALKRKGEMNELKQRIADRCALLLGNDFDTRKYISEAIAKIYGLRSKVVHTGVIIDDQNIAELSGSYARTVLLELIKKNNQFKGDFEKFITEIDDMKYR